MIHEAGSGKIACSFNATIYCDTLPDIPILTKWAQDNIDIVQTMVEASQASIFYCHHKRLARQTRNC